MNRIFITIFIIISMCACNQPGDSSKILQLRIDSLEGKMANTYTPGLGEFMSSIQIHHAKLWFAGQNQNWKLADFEVHEITETLDAIQLYQTEREESKKVEMLKPPLDAVNDAITKQNPALFDSTYLLLTNTCNNCHRVTNFEFNMVKIPDSPPFSNQAFK